MSDTKTNRNYGWGLQPNFLTQKTIAAGALKQLIVTDENTIEYEPTINNNEEWSHGFNSATDQWVEAHKSQVSHTMPGFSQELGRVCYINMADYGVATPGGGTVSRKHTFKPTDPTVTRQDPAVTYVERVGAGWHKLMPRAVGDGWTLKGDSTGVLTCDFNLLGAGLIVSNPSVTYPPTATPTVPALTGLHKLFNTQVTLTPNDGGSYNTAYACRYRSFELAFKKSMLTEAGYKPGCADFFVANNPTTGIIMSAHEFDKQMLDFKFVVDLASSTPEFDAVIDQRSIALVLDITGGIIEGAIKHQLTVTINISKYTASKPVLVDNMWRFEISGKAFFDVANSNLFKIDLTNNIATYASGW
jgi:hypothetical protein